VTGEAGLEGLVTDLRVLGIRHGQDLLVHSSLRHIGPVTGGAETVLAALRAAAGPAATIVVPTHTTGNSGSSIAFHTVTGGLSRAGLDRYRAGMPGFDPATTPSSDMGAFAEYIRTLPGSMRSGHPQTSFAAIGAGAYDCTRDHHLDCHLGESSPLGWLYRRNAAVLLLGVEYAACSAFHLAEYWLPGDRPKRAYHCFTVRDGERLEQELWDVDLDDSDFAALGQRMDTESFVRAGQVGAAWCRLVPVRRAVGFALKDRAFRQRRRPVAGSLAIPPGTREVRTAMARRSENETPGRYFFLSYARLCPLPPVPGTDLTDPPDVWVRTFFRDLSDAVSAQPASGSGLRPGFLDLEVSSGPRGRHGLADELGAAEVFVPLLSPDYCRRAWPQTEWASFEQRLRDAGVVEPQARFAPVLWVPTPAGGQVPWLTDALTDALSLAGSAALRPYVDYGLLALQRLPEYRDHYQQIVRELATRIVSVAQKAPLGPSPLSLSDVAGRAGPESGGKVFTVAVTGRPEARGGTQPAEYARLAAERRGFAVRIGAFASSAGQYSRTPGVLLVDPGSVTGNEARRELDETIAGLPSWVLPVIVAIGAASDEADDRSPLLEMAFQSCRHKPETVRRALRGVSSLREFVTLMPDLVTYAEREYLRHGPTQRAISRPASRPRLADSGRPADPLAKENPHV
jgi:aminoglycoside 3-N-acetyltransferase